MCACACLLGNGMNFSLSDGEVVAKKYIPSFVLIAVEFMFPQIKNVVPGFTTLGIYSHEKSFDLASVPPLPT